jgi:hypothetical protein
LQRGGKLLPSGFGEAFAPGRSLRSDKLRVMRAQFGFGGIIWGQIAGAIFPVGKGGGQSEVILEPIKRIGKIVPTHLSKLRWIGKIVPAHLSKLR